MAKITVVAVPDTYYTVGKDQIELETGQGAVVIHKAFRPVRFVTDSGETLAISMRDGGFEVRYYADYGEKGFVAGVTEFKNGGITLPK